MLSHSHDILRHITSLTFIHLSDVHLAGYEEGAVFDEDADLRRELTHDLRRVVHLTGGFDGLLLGGDIAGRGQRNEFDKAGEWLTGVCDEFGISNDLVYCVPGNHDVDQQVIRGDGVLQTLQKTVLESPVEKVNRQLQEILATGPHRGILLSPLEAYNEFAVRYNCDLQPERHCWEQAISFGDITLRLVGLSSALVSGPRDSREANGSRLVLGPQVSVLGRYAETFSIVLCHHPLPWLRDGATIEHFINRSHLQLFGHEHLAKVHRSGAGLRVHAGALHPPRGSEETWEPSYNVIRLTAPEEAGDPVVVEIWARALLPDGTFEALDPEKVMERYDVALVAPDAAVNTATIAETGATPRATPVVVNVEPASHIEPAPALTAAAVRAAARRFSSLAVEQRLHIGSRLALLHPEDDGLDEAARGRLVFRRATDLGRVEELQEEMNDTD